MGLSGLIEDHFKRLTTHFLECGFTPGDIRERFSAKGGRVNPKDTKEEEEEKARLAREQMEEQAEFLRRMIARTYNMNAVYFFRNVNYANAVFLNPLDIVALAAPTIEGSQCCTSSCRTGSSFLTP